MNVLTIEKLKDDALSPKLFFLICLTGTSSFISRGILDSTFVTAQDATVFILVSSLISASIFVPISGILLGSDIFTGECRELILSSVSRRSYLLSRFMAANLPLLIATALSVILPAISFTHISANFLLAVLCLLAFSIVFVSVSTIFSVLSNSTTTAMFFGGIYTIAEVGIGVFGYLQQNEFLQYLSPHATLVKGVLPSNAQVSVQLISLAILLLHSAAFLLSALYYGERRDV